MKDIIIIGASGFGREVAQWIEDINQVKPTWHIKGFLDDNLQALDNYKCDYKIIGRIHNWIPQSNDVYVCALAIPSVKKMIVDDLLSKGAEFVTIIHPTALISKDVFIGIGTVVTPFSKITSNACIGNYVSILGSNVGHDAHVGNYSTLSGRCNINGHVKIGERVYVACGVSIAPSKTIENDAYIGIGSVVISNVKAGTRVFGNPAKKMNF